jgi:hypothetical protein
MFVLESLGPKNQVLRETSVGNPDPDLFAGSGNFDRIRIGPPKGAYY